MDKSERIVVCFLTYGEPQKPRFRDHYRYSLNILRRLTLRVAPIPRFLLPVIAFRRALIRVSSWRREDYESPLESINERQIKAVESRIRQLNPGQDIELIRVFEFRPPLLPEVLHEMTSKPPGRFLLVPMYLADSDFTVGISKSDLDIYEDRYGARFFPEPEYVTSFSQDDELVEVMAQYVLEKAHEAGWDESQLRESALLLGAHGTLLKPPAGIDTGLEPTQSFYERLRGKLATNFAHSSIGWLNHTLGGEWTHPDLATAITETKNRGVDRALYFPFGFLADNAESQLEGRHIFREHPELEVLHLPCINDYGPFIKYLTRRIEQAIKKRP